MLFGRDGPVWHSQSPQVRSVDGWFIARNIRHAGMFGFADILTFLEAKRLTNVVSSVFGAVANNSRAGKKLGYTTLQSLIPAGKRAVFFTFTETSVMLIGMRCDNPELASGSELRARISCNPERND